MRGWELILQLGFVWSLLPLIMKSFKGIGIWEHSLLINSGSRIPSQLAGDTSARLRSRVPGPHALLLLLETWGPSLLPLHAPSMEEPPLSWGDFPSDIVTWGMGQVC